jgi:hypothetical protein
MVGLEELLDAGLLSHIVADPESEGVRFCGMGNRRTPKAIHMGILFATRSTPLSLTFHG